MSESRNGLSMAQCHFSWMPRMTVFKSTKHMIRHLQTAHGLATKRYRSQSGVDDRACLACHPRGYSTKSLYLPLEEETRSSRCSWQITKSIGGGDSFLFSRLGSACTIHWRVKVYGRIGFQLMGSMTTLDWICQRRLDACILLEAFRSKIVIKAETWLTSVNVRQLLGESCFVIPGSLTLSPVDILRLGPLKTTRWNHHLASTEALGGPRRS